MKLGIILLLAFVATDHVSGETSHRKWLDQLSLAASWEGIAAALKVAVNSPDNNWDSNTGAFKNTAADGSIFPEDENSMALYFDGNIVPYVESYEVKGHLAIRETQRALDLMRLSWGWYLNNPYVTESTIIEGYYEDGSFKYANDGYDNVGSYPSHSHGWSSGPMDALISYVVGLRPTAPGGAQWALEPQFGDLKWAEGFTTPLGKYSARWALNTSSYTLEYDVPANSHGILMLPPQSKQPKVFWNGKPDTQISFKNSTGLTEVSVSGGKHRLSVVRSPAIKTLLVSVFIYALTFQYCRIRFWRDPHSAFFDISNVYDWQYSLTREHEAHHFISHHKTIEQSGESNRPQSKEILKSSDEPLVCAAFVTVKRDLDDYFEGSIGSMLEGLDSRERHALYLKVIFANTNPKKHPSWGQPWLDEVIDSVATYDVPESTFKELERLEAEEDFRAKGVFDYVNALNRCMETSAPFIGIFEDDVLFAEGWFARTLNGLMTLDDTLEFRGRNESDDIASVVPTPPWLYLRLFYTETFLQWSEDDFAYRNMNMIFVLVMGIGLTISMLTRKIFPQSRSTLTYSTITVLCLVTIPAFTGLYFMIGKYSVHPLRDVVSMDSNGCCSQALVFPRQHVPSLTQYLEQEHSGQTDLMIEDFAKKAELRRFALAPPQLQHIGLRSSRKMAEIDVQSTWAFWFEANDAQKLKAEHERILEEEKMVHLLEDFE
ncbi:Immunoglobulin A1 protease autotransporter [Talaromyces islandicus]|uniref:Immunoglobulin A1 protease autotransporter n=1 Tax=Talaromyces islandicus TaxID=28573 RepID=A0A0U1MB83_TALIS|nr:Immunoglobulin A1 protease autotransporter [Talaromyces islandicus]